MSNKTQSDKKRNVSIVSMEIDERFGDGSFLSMKFRDEELQKLTEIEAGSRFVLRKGKHKDGSPVLGKFTNEQVYFLEVLPPYNPEEL